MQSIPIAHIVNKHFYSAKNNRTKFDHLLYAYITGKYLSFFPIDDMEMLWLFLSISDGTSIRIWCE